MFKKIYPRRNLIARTVMISLISFLNINHSFAAGSYNGIRVIADCKIRDEFTPQRIQIKFKKGTPELFITNGETRHTVTSTRESKNSTTFRWSGSQLSINTDNEGKMKSDPSVKMDCDFDRVSLSKFEKTKLQLKYAAKN